MPASWPTFITSVGIFLDSKIEKTEQDTARFIADTYRASILTSGILQIPGSSILNAPPPVQIENGFLETFNNIKNTNSIQISSFSPLARSITEYWQTVSWNSLPPPAGIAAPSPGVSIISSGLTPIIKSDLFLAFNSPPIPGPGGVILSTKLASVFAKHLVSISGIYTGTTPAGVIATFPWKGII